jgi:hypothetical protein
VFRRFAVDASVAVRDRRPEGDDGAGAVGQSTRRRERAGRARRLGGASRRRRSSAAHRSRGTAGFHALCDRAGRHRAPRLLPAGHEEQTWRSALEALITGFSHAPPPS